MTRRRRGVGQHLGLAELHEGASSELGKRRLLESTRERRNGAVGRPFRHRRLGRAAQGLDNRSVGARRRLEEVGRDLLRRRTELGEERGCLFVLELAFSGREVVIHRGAHEGVHEPERRLGPHDLGADQGGSRLGRRLFRQARQARCCTRVGTVTEDRERSGRRRPRPTAAGQGATAPLATRRGDRAR